MSWSTTKKELESCWGFARLEALHGTLSRYNPHQTPLRTFKKPTLKSPSTNKPSVMLGLWRICALEGCLVQHNDKIFPGQLVNRSIGRLANNSVIGQDVQWSTSNSFSTVIKESGCPSRWEAMYILTATIYFRHSNLEPRRLLSV